MKLKPLLSGAASYVPGARRLVGRRNTGGTDSARYCYSVWLRHLVMAAQSGLDTNPRIVAELGPGDSLGVGLAALISGCDRYFAFDVVGYADIQKNLSIFDELLSLFLQRTPIPGNKEWPGVVPRLDDYRFPSRILDGNRLRNAMGNARIQRIRESISDPTRADSAIAYKVPWIDSQVLEAGSVDMIVSQAVLEHVDDLEHAYRAMHRWLRPSGFMSHTIDFRSHGTAREWNGHWTYRDLLWTVIRGKRTYLLNRQPSSRHLALTEATGFRIVRADRTIAENRLHPRRLAPQFRSLSQADLETSMLFVQGAK